MFFRFILSLFFFFFIVGVCGSVLIWVVIVDADAPFAIVAVSGVVSRLVTGLALGSETCFFLMCQLDDSVNFILVNPVVLYISKILVDDGEYFGHRVI